MAVLLSSGGGGEHFLQRRNTRHVRAGVMHWQKQQKTCALDRTDLPDWQHIGGLWQLVVNRRWKWRQQFHSRLIKVKEGDSSLVVWWWCWSSVDTEPLSLTARQEVTLAQRCSLRSLFLSFVCARPALVTAAGVKTFLERFRLLLCLLWLNVWLGLTVRRMSAGRWSSCCKGAVVATQLWQGNVILEEERKSKHSLHRAAGGSTVHYWWRLIRSLALTGNQRETVCRQPLCPLWMGFSKRECWLSCQAKQTEGGKTRMPNDVGLVRGGELCFFRNMNFGFLSGWHLLEMIKKLMQ